MAAVLRAQRVYLLPTWLPVLPTELPVMPPFLERILCSRAIATSCTASHTWSLMEVRCAARGQQHKASSTNTTLVTAHAALSSSPTRQTLSSPQHRAAHTIGKCIDCWQSPRARLCSFMSTICDHTIVPTNPAMLHTQLLAGNTLQQCTQHRNTLQHCNTSQHVPYSTATPNP